MTVDPELERRVDRLENEAVAIYDLIRDETREIRGTLSVVEEEVKDIRGVLSEHSQKLDEILRRLPEPA